MSSAEEMADEVSPAIDDLERSGAVSPTIVVFATYYPDRSFVNDDFETDYQLNRFFATSEINTLIRHDRVTLLNLRWRRHHG